MMVSLDGLNFNDIFFMLLTAGSVYGAIRQDLKNIHERINKVEHSADKAHERIDTILLNSGNGQ